MEESLRKDVKKLCIDQLPPLFQLKALNKEMEYVEVCFIIIVHIYVCMYL